MINLIDVMAVLLMSW